MKNLHWIIILLAATVVACSGDRLAEVDGRDISKAEFEAYLKFKRLNPRDDAQRAKLLDQYLEREALAVAAGKAKLLDQAAIDAELREFKKEMVISRYFEKFLQDKVSDQAIQNYYTANQAQYQERKAHLRHILLRTNPNLTDTERQAKRTTIQEAQSKIKAGKDFVKIAADYSEDANSAKKGGDLGWMKEGAVDKNFSAAAFALEPGAVSDIVETPFGYHLIKLEEGPTVVTRPLEAAKGDIRYLLRNQAKDGELKRLSSSVKISKESGS